MTAIVIICITLNKQYIYIVYLAKTFTLEGLSGMPSIFNYKLELDSAMDSISLHEFYISS